MLSREENELLARVGPDMPMGKLMRRYWIPALLSEEIPEPDCAPVKVRLLGEELVAFRDSQGKVGLLAEHCSHRGTSLYYGRNEEGGLRCIYHGWKYDVEGRVFETPAEPPGSEFKDKIRHPWYPCKEAAGIVFTYMGPKEMMPLFPNYEWLGLPREQSYSTKIFQECNYLQGLEGDCDSSHLSYLHRMFREGSRFGVENDLYAMDGAPELEAEETDYGLRMISVRRVGAQANLIRVTNFIMPCLGFVPAGPGGLTTHYHVPIDGTHAWKYYIAFRRGRPLQENERNVARDLGSDYKKIRNIHNQYLQDRDEQRKRTFAGVGTSFPVQDSCVTESMGPVADRTREHLGVSDITVIALRTLLLKAVRCIENGQEPPHIVRDPSRNSFSHVDCISATVPSHKSPKGYVVEHIRKRVESGRLE